MEAGGSVEAGVARAELGTVDGEVGEQGGRTHEASRPHPRRARPRLLWGPTWGGGFWTLGCLFIPPLWLQLLPVYPQGDTLSPR